jgi:hypothetical protein
MNIANEGGVFYIESDSNATSTFEMYSKNTALISGGVMAFTTRSFFTIINSKFLNNYAITDSTITALKLST